MRKNIFNIALSFLLTVLSIGFLKNAKSVRLFLLIIAYIVAGHSTVIISLRNIFRGNIFDENFLMTISSVGAFIIGNPFEGVAVMLFFQIGELFQKYAVNKSRKSISSLMDICPDRATVLRNDRYYVVDCEQINIGETILIKPGERVPLDCIITNGETSVDTSSITGEAFPRLVSCGDNILSGFINESHAVFAQVTKEFSESTASKILELVENASMRKSKSENFITKFSRFYTPFVVLSALIIALVPPLFSDSFSFSKQICIALSFLVASCPCALVISVPLSFFSAIGAAARRGILVKGSNSLESLSRTKVVAFDKTGTLTKGVFSVQTISPVSISPESLLEIAAFCEYYSEHPIAKSIKKAHKEEINCKLISSFEELPGVGVCAKLGNELFYAGNKRLMERQGFNIKEENIDVCTVYICNEKEYLGCITISDEIKEDSKSAICQLKQLGITKTVMLTGDISETAQDIALKLSIDEVHSQLLPADKLRITEHLLSQCERGEKLAFLGDGINDTPVLSRADIGIAMGGLGQDAAIDTADIVIMTDEPSKLPEAIRLSKYTLNIVKENIIFSLFVKGLILILSSLSLTSMWAAVFADVGVSVIAILNSIRILRKKQF
ncbi:MAG: cadmium-translocating P-type ATPase [Ruminococcaceae bacterium]|nr:cadmium-translocating P-type ATPase [Oscillospiraceae bacterium]